MQLPSQPKIVYVCVASADAVSPADLKLVPEFLQLLADLTLAYPQHVFLSPSLNNYTLLPWMRGEVGADYEAWKDRCRLLLAKCDCVLVFDSVNWKKSIGVKDELEMAVELKLPVYPLNDLKLPQ